MSEKNNNYYLGKDYPEVYFTQREMDCLVHLLDGHTIVSAAQELGLSPRTVEFYVRNMRMKMGASSKAALLKAIRETNFMDRFTFNPSLNKTSKVSEPESM